MAVGYAGGHGGDACLDVKASRSKKTADNVVVFLRKRFGGEVWGGGAVVADDGMVDPILRGTRRRNTV